MKKTEQLLFFIILILSFTLRLYRIDYPLADWHSWRQVDTSSVSRIFVEDGIDLLHPRYHDLSNIPSGFDNPKGYRFVEFPIYNLLQATLFILFNNIALETWGRLISVLASVISTFVIFHIVKKYSDSVSALFAAFFYAVIPYNLYFGRTVLPDTLMVSSILLGIYFFDRWCSGQNKFMNLDYFFAILSTAAAFLLKPYSLFLTLPILFLSYKKFKNKIFINRQLLMFLFLTVTPLILWRLYIKQYPSGIPVSDWLFNGGDIRFKGAFFYWLFADRIARLISGYWGIVLLVIGMLVASGRENIKKSSGFLYTFLLGSLLYLIVIARGNVQHDYYQIFIIPSLVIFMGIGARALLFPNIDYINKYLSRLLLIIIIAFSLSFSWYYIRDFYNINNQSLIIAGNAVDKLTPKNAKIIAPYEGDTTLLYFTKRSGWPSFQNPIPELIRKGATHLLLVNPTDNDFDFGNEYKIIGRAEEYLILDLLNKP